MSEFEVALTRWRAAEKACANAQLSFGRTVRLYLMRRGPAPGPSMAQDLTAARTAAAHARADLYAALQRCRQSVPLL